MIVPTDDLHLLPFDGVADWDDIARRLNKYNYDDILTFELTTISKKDRYENDIYKEMPIHKDFERVFQYLKNMEEASVGKTVLDEGNVWINVMDIQDTKKGARSFEAHRDFIDVHYIYSGSEEFGYSNIDRLHTTVEIGEIYCGFILSLLCYSYIKTRTVYFKHISPLRFRNASEFQGASAEDFILMNN